MSILRGIFGNSKEEVWKQLSHKIGATYVGGSWVDSDKVVAEHKHWKIILDAKEGKHSYTRIRAAFINKDGFKFNIYRTGFFSYIGVHLLGMEDAELGFDDFDCDFIIQGNDHYKLWKLFAHDRIRIIIKQHPSVNLKIKTANTHLLFNDFDDNVDVIEFKVRGILKDVKQLSKMFDLFAEVLDHLCTIGSAYEDDPTLTNYYT